MSYCAISLVAAWIRVKNFEPRLHTVWQFLMGSSYILHYFGAKDQWLLLALFIMCIWQHLWHQTNTNFSLSKLFNKFLYTSFANQWGNVLHLLLCGGCHASHHNLAFVVRHYCGAVETTVLFHPVVLAQFQIQPLEQYACTCTVAAPWSIGSSTEHVHMRVHSEAIVP
jgi:hypothetical protein